MAYATRDDIERQYGVANVAKWADLENENAPDDVEDRIEWALEAATSDVEDRLRDGPYSVPFCKPYPNLIVRLTAMQAGILLYESRGVTDYDADGAAQDQLQWQRKKFDEDIRDILVRRIRLAASLTVVSYPQVINQEDE